jgi:phosphatidate phosphatase LPIN
MSPPSSFPNSNGGTSTDSHSKPVSPQQNIHESSLIEDKKNEPVFQLPPGPVITSPDRLFTAFTREVILRRPQEFKIAALRNIVSLFPEGSSPIIAGFGNRDTDVLAYKAVGVPNGRIFIISPTGEVQTDNKTFQKTYEWINSHVDSIFPFCKQLASNYNVGAKMGIPILENQNFTDTAFWKRTIPTLTLTDEADAGGISKKSVVIIKKQR